MEIQAIAIDDENLALNKIARFAEKIGYLNLIERFSNAHDSLAYLKKNPVDLIFLDIQMDEFSGIEFIEALENKPRIILTTAFDSYAIKGYELGVTDYLLKPISFKRFVQAVEKAYAEIEKDKLFNPGAKTTTEGKKKEYVFIKSGTKEVKLYLDDILYMEGLKDYISIYTQKGRIVTLHSFKSIMEFLDDANLLRVHKSYIVALDKIEYFEHNHLHIGGKRIPVSNTYKLSLQEHFKKP
jgi:DNA-binding LytR/AlgR family response regulator